MSSLPLRTTVLAVLVCLLFNLAHCSPIELQTRNPHTSVANHPISGISDFHPASIAAYEAGDTNEDVAICLAIKNEYHDLTEWIVHHYNHHNIRRFYIMDDGSNPRMSSYDYSEFVDERALTHRYMDPATRHKVVQQHVIYQQCMSEFGAKHKWMGFIDTDEFLEVKAPDTLHGMLTQLGSNATVGALGVNWLNHNSNGLEQRPPGKGIRESFTQCLKDEAEIDSGGNNHIKSFVKTEAWEGAGSVHKTQLKEGYETVGENGDVVTEAYYRVPSTKDKIVLHHYATKSRREYEVKLQRGDVMGEGQLRGEKYWKEMKEAPSYECMEMVAYSP